MRCDDARKLLPLLLYGELTFEEEDGLELHLADCEACRQALSAQESLHAVLDREALPVSLTFTAQCRRELYVRLEQSRTRNARFWGHWAGMFSIRPVSLRSALQPMGAVALVCLGFFASRLVDARGGASGLSFAGLAEPVSTRVRYLEPESFGNIQVVVEETRQRVVSGNVDDEVIQHWLLTASKDSTDPGLRAISVGMLKDHPESAEVREALLAALEHDTNSGVRLKALEGLKDFAGEPETRTVLSRVLLNDSNPGVRAQVINLLIDHRGDRTVGTIQELMRKEDNKYILLRCRKALHDWNASEGTF